MVLAQSVGLEAVFESIAKVAVPFLADWSTVDVRSDDGKSFKGETAVYTAPGGSICPCCQPTVAGNGRTVVVQFRNKLRNLKDGADYNDMFTAVSTDGGRKWKVTRLDDRERWKG